MSRGCTVGTPYVVVVTMLTIGACVSTCEALAAHLYDWWFETHPLHGRVLRWQRGDRREMAYIIGMDREIRCFRVVIGWTRVLDASDA